MLPAVCSFSGFSYFHNNNMGFQAFHFFAKFQKHLAFVDFAVVVDDVKAVVFFHTYACQSSV